MTSSKVIQLNQDEFTQEVLESDRPVLVDFWADWCQPCHALAPTIDEIAESYRDRVKVAKVDIDANSELAGNYSINSIPTVLIFKDGVVSERLIGVRSSKEYATALEARLN